MCLIIAKNRLERENRLFSWTNSRINCSTTHALAGGPLPAELPNKTTNIGASGTCSIFVAVEPKGGKRFVQTRRHRKRADFARFVRDLIKRYPKARRIHLVLDNLNTHNPKSLIDTFGAKAARPLLNRIVWHHTPTHASWLNPGRDRNIRRTH